MLRRFLVPLIAFLAPFVVFAIYRALRHRKLDTSHWPLTILFVTGAVLAVQTFALAALTEPRTVVRAPEATIEEPRP